MKSTTIATTRPPILRLVILLCCLLGLAVAMAALTDRAERSEPRRGDSAAGGRNAAAVPVATAESTERAPR